MDILLSPIKDPSQNHTKGNKPLEYSILTQCFFEVLGLLLIPKLKHLGMKIWTILFKENEGAFLNPSLLTFKQTNKTPI
jgi:hypothetical protein